MNESQYEIFQLLKENYEEVMKFTSTYYVSAEPISLLVNTTAQEFANAYQKFFMLACTSGLSYGFKKQAEIVAVALVLNYKIYSQPLECIPKLMPLQVLIQSLSLSYIPQNIDKTAAVFVVTTHPQHKNKGLCSKLIEKVQKKAKQLGIEEIVADCTNPISQNIFTKAGFRVTKRIYYNQFQTQGKRPFQGIKFAESITHVSKLL